MLSELDRAILDGFEYLSNALIVKAETTFTKLVTFSRAVVFQASVTFGGRVIFEDEDMAGTATIQAGATSVEIYFSRPYEVIPKITASSNSFVSYKITGKSTDGFTISLAHAADTDVSFDWVALMVRGAKSSRSARGEVVIPPPAEETTPVVSGEVSPPVEVVTPPSAEETPFVEEVVSTGSTSSGVVETPAPASPETAT